MAGQAPDIFGEDGRGALPEVQFAFPVDANIQLHGHVTPLEFAGVLQVQHPNLAGSTFYNLQSRESWS